MLKYIKMKKTIIFLMLLSTTIFAQDRNSKEYKKIFDNICISLDKNNFNELDFENSIRLFIFAKNTTLVNDEINKTEGIQTLNEVFSYMQYNKYKISEAKSSLDHGFIIELYLENKIIMVYLVLSKNEKIQTVLIR
jgi:hypothetical protein